MYLCHIHIIYPIIMVKQHWLAALLLQVRFLARSFAVPGDHEGQMSHGYRYPYGPVAIISPFNFPLEIPSLQIMGALYMGNKVVFKGDPKVSVVMEQVRGYHCRSRSIRHYYFWC